MEKLSEGDDYRSDGKESEEKSDKKYSDEENISKVFAKGSLIFFLFLLNLSL